MNSPAHDPTGLLAFQGILAEAKARGYVDRALWDVAAKVYTRRTGQPCPFMAPGEYGQVTALQNAPANFNQATSQLNPPPEILTESPKAPKLLEENAVEPKLATIDFETRSRAELKDCGADKYAADPSTDVLCLAYQLPGRAQPALWRPGDPPPAELFAHVAAGGLVEAHNAAFEMAIWQHVCTGRLGWPAVPDVQWRDSMAAVAALALPLSLDGASRALGLDTKKDAQGAVVMRRLCKPRKPTKHDQREWHDDPADYQKLYDYCRQDVRVEHAVSATVPRLSEVEERRWLATMRCNRRGIGADRAGIGAALRMLQLGAELISERVRDATHGALTGADLGRREAVLEWCRSRGVSLADYTKGGVSEALAIQGLPDDVRVVLTARQALGRTSTAKYQAMLDRLCDDDRIRGGLVYHGAATGRWAGRGIQPQNFPRHAVEDVDACLADAATLSAADFEARHGDPFAALVGCLRGCLTAGPGKVLVAADYAAIEARVLLWLAGDRGVRIFREYDAGTGADIYKVMASDIYGVPPADVTKDQRFMGKTAVLGLGYGMGPAKFIDSCATLGVTVDMTFAQRVVNTYRAKFRAVKEFWYAVEAAAVAAVEAGLDARPQVSGPVRFKMVGKHLFCRLPSGRKLCYPFAALTERPTPWGELRRCVAFMGEDTYTRQWSKQDTYGGKLVENITQGVARDVMATALVALDDGGYRPVMLVHDEAVCEVDAMRAGAAVVREVEQVMCALPEWASGLPITAKGWCGKRYRKD